MNSKTTQADRILNYIKDHGSITSLEAFQNLGCTRLSGRIYDLRQMGYDIKSEMKDVPARYGRTRVAVYTLTDEEGVLN